MSRADEARERKALSVRVAINLTFTHDDLKAIGALTGIDEPSRADLKRWMLRTLTAGLDQAASKLPQPGENQWP